VQKVADASRRPRAGSLRAPLDCLLGRSNPEKSGGLQNAQIFDSLEGA